MSRMSKKQKEEWAFFINPKSGRRQYHTICRKCSHDCKQSWRVQLLACPRFNGGAIGGTNASNRIGRG